MRSRLLAVAALVMVPMGACGGGAGPTAIDTASEASSGSPLPAVDVADLHTGEPASLAAQLPADKPLLVWFWAPH